MTIKDLFKLKLTVLVIAFLGFGNVISAQTGTLVTTVEAENGVFSGGVVKGTSFAGYAGTGYATNFIDVVDKVTVTVNIPSRAFYVIYIRYHSDYKKQYVSVNGDGASDVEFVSTGSSWGTCNAGKYLLNAGNNTITVQKSWGWCDIDQFKIYTTTLNTYTDITTSLNDTEATVATKSLYNYMYSQFGKRIISGQTDGAYYDSIKSITGKSPLYRTWDFSHYTEGYPYLWKNGGFAFGIDINDKSTENAIAWYKTTGRKGIVGFHWHWCSPSGGSVGTNTFYTAYTTFDVTKAVQQGTTEYTLIIRDIDAIAVQLKKLQAQNVPILWRPLHEAGGGWFWWGAKGSVACKQLWAIMFDRLMNYHKLHNLIWVWSSPESEWYPGNNTADIVGYDSYPGDYNYSTQKVTFDQYFANTQGKKIIAMSENGPIPNPDDCLDYDTPWSLFMAWTDLVKAQNSVQHIKDVYQNNRVLTLENDTFPMIITAANNAVCDSGTVTLGATSNFGSVKWYAVPEGDTAIFTGTSFTTPKIYTNTTYYVEASYNNNPSEIKRIPVKANIVTHVYSLQITGLQAICKVATSIPYSVDAKPNIDSYTWTIPSGSTGTSSTNSINVTFGSSALSGNITVKGHNICGDGPTDTLSITVNDTPIAPVITLLGDTLKSNALIGNQWYFNNSMMQYATFDSCIVSKSGNYYAIVTLNGCASLPSNTILATLVGVDELVSNSGIRVYPNPTSGRVTILFNKKFTDDCTLMVYNNTGCLLQTVNMSKQKSEIDIDLGSLPAGLYILHLNTLEKQYFIKVIKK